MPAIAPPITVLEHLFDAEAEAVLRIKSACWRRTYSLDDYIKVQRAIGVVCDIVNHAVSRLAVSTDNH